MMTGTDGGTSPVPLNTISRASLTNMQVRVLAGLPWLAAAIACLIWGEWPWTVFITLAATFGLLEFYGMAQGRPEQPISWVGALATIAIMLGVELNNTPLWLGALIAAAVAAVVFAAARDRKNAARAAGMTLVGLLYVTLPLATTVILRRDIGVFGVMLAIFVTVGTDTAAYFGGRLWGRRPLAPRISPKKTVEGFIVGLIGGALLTGTLLSMAGGLYGAGILIPLFGPLLAVVGDLLESALKRYYQMKDSHLPRFNVIPGHGGVLDRADSLLLVAPFVAAVMALMGML